MTEFVFDEIWREIEECHPFLIDIMQAFTGKYHKEVSDDLKTKYSFIYGILMHIRWHEISLMQRINTVLLIEGGCGKKVGQIILQFYNELHTQLCLRTYK